MERFKNILLYMREGVDPEPALRRAATLAVENEASLTVVDVLPVSSEEPYLTLAGRPELVEAAVATRELELKSLVPPIQEHGVPVETHVLTGKPFIEIIRRVLLKKHDLVMKTAEGERGPGRLFGSTALHLFRKCPCPVWVIKPQQDGPKGRILAAVDPNPNEPEQHNLSMHVLELAASLAESEGSELQIVYAWGPWSLNSAQGWLKNMQQSHFQELRETARNDAKRRLDKLVEGYDLSSVRYDVYFEMRAAYEVIVALAEDVDTIVMGTLSKRGLAGVYIGSTAERVLAQLDCSVLAVKPEGFVTPVRPGKQEVDSVGGR